MSVRIFALFVILFFGISKINSQNIPPFVSNCGLRAWYPFTGNMIDSTGLGNNGNQNGGVQLIPNRFGTANSAYRFDGNNDVINLGTFIGILNTFSISFWIRNTMNETQIYPNNNIADVISRETNGPPFPEDWLIYMGQGGRLYFKHGNWGGPTQNNHLGPVVNNNVWHHIVLVRNNGQVKWYFNGTLFATYPYNNFNLNNNLIPIQLGRRTNPSGGDFYEGDLDDIAFYNREITLCEVQNLYNQSTTNCFTPTITAGGPTTFCQGGSVTLTSSTASTYLWSNGATTQSINATQSGNYTVQVTNASGCIYTSTATSVTVNPLPVVTISPSGPTSFCQGGNVTLSATSGTSYLWSNGATSQNITVSTTGNYTVTVTNANNCSSSSPVSTVTVSALPTVSITPSGPTTFCQGSSVSLSATAGTGYLWSTGATTQTINTTQAGNYQVTVTNANNCSSSTPVTAITVNSLPTSTIFASGPTTFCQGGNVTLSASPGTAYLWSNGATSQNVTINQSGNYVVTVTNANNCTSASAATLVTVNTPPTSTITPSGMTTFCQGGSVTLTASPGSSYLWSNGSTTQDVTVNTSGNYTVTVTDANNCTSASLATAITVNPLPSVSITASGPTTFCQGGSVTLTASSGASYLWSNGATTQAITVSSSGNYSVTVTNANNCSSTSQPTLVTVNPSPSAIISPSGPTTFCQGGNVVLTASAGSSYLWSNGATSQTLTVTQAGNYSVTVTNASGCTSASLATAVFVNTLPAASITPSGPTTFCQGSAVTLTASLGSSYQWSDGSTSQSISVSQSGNYFVTVTNANNCSSSSAVTAVVVNTLPVVTISASGPTTFCQGSNVTLTATSGSSYLWSDGSTSQSITVSQAGNYSVIVTSAAGCSSASQVTGVTVNSLPTASITASGPTTFCQGGSVTLTSSVGNTYFWSTGATTQSITVTQGGSYSVVVTNASGCSSASSPTSVVVSSQQAASITASGPTTFCQGNNVTLNASAGSGFLWSNGATTQSITVNQAGNYSVTITNVNGCSTTSGAVAVVVNPLPVIAITPSGPTTFCQGSNVILTASGGTSFLWSNGATTQSITVTQSGNFSVVATDANGCSSATPSTNVLVNPLPTSNITPSGPTTFCQGGNVTLSATPGTSYLWSNGATTQSITVNQTGNYNVIVTNASNCQSSSSVVPVIVNSLPTVTVSTSGPTTFCQGGNVTLIASTSSSYLWSNGATTQSINVIQSGNYTVTVTNANGCSTSSAPVSVVVNALPNTIISPSGSTTFCQGGSVTLNAPPGATSYLWSNGSTAASITVTQSGNYTVTETNANNCSSTSLPMAVTVFSLPNAVITPSGPTTFCQGGSVTLTASTGSSYVWSNAATSQSITVNQAGNYSVVVTNANNCTSASLVMAIAVNTAPVASITASGPTTFCQGGDVILTASPGATYQWSNGASSQSITVSQSGTYSVTVTNANNCSATSPGTSITVQSLPQAIISPSGPTLFCNGNNVTLSASPGSSYLWNTGATTQSITVSTAGNYSVTVTNANNCSATSLVTGVNVNPLPTVNITPSGPTSFCQGGFVTLTATAGSSYFWSTGATTQSITVNQSGNYNVTVTNANGCSSISTPTTITVNAAPTASITPSGPTNICQGSTVTLTSSPASSYLWSNGATTQSITVSQGGNYNVNITNANNCSAFSPMMIVNVYNLPNTTITPSGSTNLCQGDTVTLTATTGTSYLWSTGATTQSINVGVAGNYIVTVTNANNCSSASSITSVVVNPIPSASIFSSGPTSVCVGDSVTLTASSASSYLWNNGATTQSITVYQSGNYVVTVTSANNCTSSASPMVVTVNALPAAAITSSGPTNICTGSNVTLSATATPGFSYFWSNGSTAQSITVSTPGNYSVTITDINGCSSNSTAINVTNVSYPSANIFASGPTTLCQGDNVILTSSPGDAYLWSDGSTTQSITATQAGSYIVTVTNGSSCSSTSTSTAVIVNPVPTAVITASGPTTFCDGDFVSLTSSNGDTYLWSNGFTTQSINITQSGTYQVTVSNAFNCTASSTPEVIVVNPSTSATASVVICDTYTWPVNSQTYTASGNYVDTLTNVYGCDSILTLNLTILQSTIITEVISACDNYTWPVNNSTYSESGNYSDTLTNIAGCDSIIQLVLTINSSPVVTVSGDNEICPGSGTVLVASGANTYSWSDGTIGDTLTILNDQTGSYVVTATSIDGCTTTLTVPVTYQTIDAINDNVSVKQPDAVTIEPLLNDIGSAGVTIISGPFNGNVQQSGDQLVYVPDPGYTGNDLIQYVTCSDECASVCDTATINITVIPADEIVLPGGITPNGDGYNDTWIVEGIEKYPSNRLFILNRWGDVVYESAPYQNEWVGQSNRGPVIVGNVLTDGTYFYNLQLEPNGVVYKGFIELVK